MKFILLVIIELPLTVGISISISRINFILSSVKKENKYINLLVLSICRANFLLSSVELKTVL